MFSPTMKDDLWLSEENTATSVTGKRWRGLWKKKSRKMWGAPSLETFWLWTRLSYKWQKRHAWKDIGFLYKNVLVHPRIKSLGKTWGREGSQKQFCSWVKKLTQWWPAPQTDLHFLLNALEQPSIWQTNGLIFECILAWTFTSDFVLNILPHLSHGIAGRWAEQKY